MKEQRNNAVIRTGSPAHEWLRPGRLRGPVCEKAGGHCPSKGFYALQGLEQNRFYWATKVRLRNQGPEEPANLDDKSGSGRSPVPLIVVAKFIPRKRMPLWGALPATIFNLRAFLPESEAQIGSMIFNVRVRTSSGQPELASLTIMINKSSRAILATSAQLREMSPDFGKLIARALAPPAARPVDKLLCPEALRRVNFPWPGLLNDAVHAAAAARRLILRPSKILVDEEDRSPDAEAACRELGITLVTSLPTLCAHAVVERAFSTIRKQFVDRLPGQSRRYYRDNDEKDLILLEDLAVLFDRWVVQIWPYVRGNY